MPSPFPLPAELGYRTAEYKDLSNSVGNGVNGVNGHGSHGVNGLNGDGGNGNGANGGGDVGGAEGTLQPNNTWRVVDEVGVDPSQSMLGKELGHEVGEKEGQRSSRSVMSTISNFFAAPLAMMGFWGDDVSSQRTNEGTTVHATLGFDTIVNETEDGLLVLPDGTRPTEDVDNLVALRGGNLAGDSRRALSPGVSHEPNMTPSLARANQSPANVEASGINITTEMPLINQTSDITPSAAFPPANRGVSASMFPPVLAPLPPLITPRESEPSLADAYVDPNGSTLR